MTSTIKVNNIQNQCGANIANKCGTTITLGASGDTINLASGASQTGFGRTGTVDWDTTVKTASFTADTGDGYFVNTTSGAITVTLPAGTANAIVSLADYAATWQTNNLTVTPNGTDKIGGTNANAILDTKGQSVTFVYVDSTQGWINTMDSTSNVRGNNFIVATGGTITCCGDFKIHTFTGPGTFCVSQISATPANNEVSYIVVGGGGAGGKAGSSKGGAGGGAGGFRESRSGVDTYTASPLEGATNISVTATGFPITVGGGGAGIPGAVSPQDQRGGNGNVSTFSTVTGAAGGGGGSGGTCGPGSPGHPGGSGGGGGYECSGSPKPGGTGNTPPVSPAQGFNGGASSPGPRGSFHNRNAGGGGGATVIGTEGGACSPPSTPTMPTTQAGGPGGNGATTSITGSPTTYAGGGGGGSGTSMPSWPGLPTSNFIGQGGSGGGAPAGPYPAKDAPAATGNTGGGGGGGTANCGNSGNGGSGVVIIRYKYQ
jgi:hypothetical protein